MYSLPEARRLLSWLSHELAVPSSIFVLEGRREHVPTVFVAFACLYPDVPYFRLITAVEDLDEQGLRLAIAACQMPSDAEYNHQYYMLSHYQGVNADVGWREAVRQGRAAQLPLGFLAIGRTILTEEVRAVACLHHMVSPTRFLGRLKQAAQ